LAGAWDPGLQAAQLFESTIEFLLQLRTLLLVHLLDDGGDVVELLASPLCERGDHVQIAQRLRNRGACVLGLRLRLYFQEQIGLLQNPLADFGRGLAPGAIELPGLPGAEVLPRQGGGHGTAILQAGVRRYQVLHRYLSRDGAGTHLLLHALRQQIDQGQPARHPTKAAIELPCQGLQSVAESLL
jgi:hypothetical protein